MMRYSDGQANKVYDASQGPMTSRKRPIMQLARKSLPAPLYFFHESEQKIELISIR